MATGRFGQVVRNFIFKEHFAGLRNVTRRYNHRLKEKAALALILRDIAADLAAIANLATGVDPPTAVSVTSNNVGTFDIDGGVTFTFELDGVALSCPVSDAIVQANSVLTTAVTVAEMVVILHKAGLTRRGVVASINGIGNAIVLTPSRLGIIVLDTFAGTLETTMDWTGGATIPGTGYQPLTAVAAD